MYIAGIPLLKIMQISPIFDLLLACLLLLIWVAVERLRMYNRISMDKGPFMDQIKSSIASKRYDEAIQYSSSVDKPLSNMVKVGLVNRNKTAEDISELMEASRMSDRVKLEKFLPILGTLGNSAVFVGLLGTVIGIIRAFKLLENAGSEGATAIMVGIAEALVSTAMGLLVAIPAVMVFNAFMGRVKNWYIEMEVTSKELLAEMVGEEAAANNIGKTIKKTQVTRKV